MALDTFPYNSHTTASDALWAGVPLVTLKGETFASRVASSLLTTHGFPDLIAHNEGEYKKRVLELATDHDYRAQLKSALNQARLSSPLFDTARFTRELEGLYRAITADHTHPANIRGAVVSAQLPL
ncbi:MAG: hypothetical protein QM744_11525 [Mesorhizobium sp.]